MRAEYNAHIIGAQLVACPMHVLVNFYIRLRRVSKLVKAGYIWTTPRGPKGDIKRVDKESISNFLLSFV